jgi:hypothetical protein
MRCANKFAFSIDPPSRKLRIGEHVTYRFWITPPHTLSLSFETSVDKLGDAPAVFSFTRPGSDTFGFFLLSGDDPFRPDSRDIC